MIQSTPSEVKTARDVETASDMGTVPWMIQGTGEMVVADGERAWHCVTCDIFFKKSCVACEFWLQVFFFLPPSSLARIIRDNIPHPLLSGIIPGSFFSILFVFLLETNTDTNTLLWGPFHTPLYFPCWSYYTDCFHPPLRSLDIYFQLLS